MTRAIINVATGGFYQRKQEKLIKSLLPYINDHSHVDEYAKNNDIRWRNESGDYNYGKCDLITWEIIPHSSKSHNESPYGFKVHAFNFAAILGYTSILWIDSPAYAVADPAPIFEKMEKEGYYVMSHIDPLENYVGDDVLQRFQVTREQIAKEKLNLPSGSCYGFDLNSHKGRTLFENMLMHEKEGLFSSTDPRHRHDEAVLALNMRNYKFPVFTFDPLFQSDSLECVIKSGDGQPE